MTADAECPREHEAWFALCVARRLLVGTATRVKLANARVARECSTAAFAELDAATQAREAAVRCAMNAFGQYAMASGLAEPIGVAMNEDGPDHGGDQGRETTER